MGVVRNNDINARNKIRVQRQHECVEAIAEHDYNCYILASVGFGKTIMAFMVLRRMLDEGKLQEGDRVLFQTSGTSLIKGFDTELKIYEEIFEYDLSDKLEFMVATYQSRTLVTDIDFDFVINDEFDYVGSFYSEDFTYYPYRMLCMSGTLASKEKFNYRGVEMTKKQWIEQRLPCAFNYPIEQAREDGIVVPFETEILYHNLSDRTKGPKMFKNQSYLWNEETFYQKARGYMAEYQFFDEDAFKQSFELTFNASDYIGKRLRSKPLQAILVGITDPKVVKAKVYKYRLQAAKKAARSRFDWYMKKAVGILQQCPSKVAPLRRKIFGLKGRTIVYAPNLAYLDKVVGKQRVIRPKTDILERFNNKEINIIGTAKKILRGVTPVEVDNLVMVCPIGSATTFEQLIGRVIRLDHRADKIAKLFIVVTLDTYEENWLARGCKRGGSVIDLNITETNYLV